MKPKLIYTTLIFALCLFASCDTYQVEKEYNKRSWEIKIKEMELDHLERLYRIKSYYETEMLIKSIEERIKVQEAIVDSLYKNDIP